MSDNNQTKSKLIKHWRNGVYGTYTNTVTTDNTSGTVTYNNYPPNVTWKDWGTNIQVPSPTHFVCPNCIGIFPMKQEFVVEFEGRKLSFCSDKCSKDFDMSKLVPMEI